MGRKIPGRKHRGVIDPEKQREERFNKIKNKINTAPSNPDEQQIPKSLAKIMELKTQTKEGLFKKKKKTKKPKDTKPLRFVQQPGESNQRFKSRMYRECGDVIKEAAFANKYRVDIKRNEQGEVERVVKRPKDELEVLVKELKKERKDKGKKKKKKDAGGEREDKLTKSQKWALKKSERKRKIEQKRQEDDLILPKTDYVGFGEVAHAPPSLVAPRRAKTVEGAPRPGAKHLLLNSMLHNSAPRIQNTSKIDRKGKRKDLPNALRRQLEKQQSEVIEAYKELKLKNKSK